MKGKMISRIGAALLSCAVIATSLPSTAVVKAVSGPGFNYGEALRDTIIFYDANKCGKDAGENNFFDWRGACHTTDGADVGLDLTGGYHDCGDHVKFGITEGYAASILEWSYYRYKDIFERTGNSEKMLQQLKHFTDYFLKCHPTSDVFYYQCGDGTTDHSYWGPPEEQTTSRPTMFKADSSNAASDVLGESAAALALMYLNYNDIDPEYSEKCLTAAKELYNMGKSNQGLSNAQGFYYSSTYKDDLAWAATWLYTITKDQSYLDDAAAFVIEPGSGLPLEDKWTMCWDDMFIPAEIRLYEITGDQIYKNALAANINFWENGIETTPGGLKFLNSWGVLRYSAAEAMVALIYSEDTGDEGALNLAKSQIDYILGDNPENMSYVIGYGSKWPAHPHHRAANGYTYIDNGNLKPAKNLLLGGLMGGPDSSDHYNDDGSQYQCTETGIDYDAGLLGALAGLEKIYGSADKTLDTVMTPTTTTFDRSKPADITIPTEFNGNEIDSVVNGAVPLTKGTDYTVTDNAVIISKSYLSAQTGDSVTLMFLTTGGKIPKITITYGSSGDDGSSSSSGSSSSGSSGGTQPGALEVQMFNGNTSPVTNGIMPKFRLINTGNSPIQLADIKLRYYYTSDGSQQQNFWCDWSSVGSSNVSGRFEKLPSAKESADSYLEISFSSAAGSIAPGEAIEVQARFSKSDWTNYDQSNDYSFNATDNSYVDWNKVTAYSGDNLIWGVEPQ